MKSKLFFLLLLTLPFNFLFSQTLNGRVFNGEGIRLILNDAGKTGDKNWILLTLKYENSNQKVITKELAGFLTSSNDNNYFGDFTYKVMEYKWINKEIKLIGTDYYIIKISVAGSSITTYVDYFNEIGSKYWSRVAE